MSESMSEFLQYKIGYHDDKTNKDYGMCMNILNKCQNYTYTTKGKKTTYDPTNAVIKQFLQRALVQIKTKQDEVLSEYAEDCLNDVSSCLTSNGFDVSATTTASKNRVAINSCYAQIKTCMSVNGNLYDKVSTAEINNWVHGIFTDVETFESTAEIKNRCMRQTDAESCYAVRGYCLVSTTTSKIDQLQLMQNSIECRERNTSAASSDETDGAYTSNWTAANWEESNGAITVGECSDYNSNVTNKDNQALFNAGLTHYSLCKWTNNTCVIADGISCITDQ